MNLKKTLAMLLVLCFMFALLPFGAALAADDGDKADRQPVTGTFGNGFQYKFVPATGVLTIRYTGTGSGSLRAFSAGEEAPWAAFIAEIRELVIEEGVTRIGDSVFANIENLEVVRLPKSIVDIKTNAFTGCNRVMQVLSAGNLAKLTTMLNANNVAELILEEVAEAVNEQAIAYEIQNVTATANAAKQEAAAAGKPVETQVIEIGASTEKEVTVEGNVTTEVNDISHPALQGKMAHVVREITTHADGTKTVKETITSIDDNSYRSEGTHTLDAQGRTVFSEETAVKDGKTTITKVKTQYKNTQDKTGVQVQETVFVEDGLRMIGAVLLNSDGMRATETMYTYKTETDEQGNRTEKLVEAKQTVNEFYENGNMKTSTNTYYTPKDESVAPQLYNEDGSINETGYQINTDNYNYDREDQLQFAEQGGPPIGGRGPAAEGSAQQQGAPQDGSVQNDPQQEQTVSAQSAGPDNAVQQDSNAPQKEEEQGEQDGAAEGTGMRMMAKGNAAPAAEEEKQPEEADLEVAEAAGSTEEPARKRVVVTPAEEEEEGRQLPDENPQSAAAESGDAKPAEGEGSADGAGESVVNKVIVTPAEEEGGQQANDPQQPASAASENPPAQVDAAPAADPPLVGETPAADAVDPPVEQDAVPQGE